MPRPRVVAIDLAPAACRLQRVSIAVADIARARVEARMALAEVRGLPVRRIIIVAPQPPATL